MKSRLRQGLPVDVLTCNGDLDAQHMVTIGNKVLRLIGRKHKHVLIDLGKARSVDLAGLGILVERLRRIRAAQGDIRLCNLRPQVSKTFQLVGLNGLIELYDSKEEAIASFRVA